MKFDNQMAGSFKVNEQVEPPIDWTLLYGSEASIPQLGLIVRPEPVNSLMANPAPGPSNKISGIMSCFSSILHIYIYIYIYMFSPSISVSFCYSVPILGPLQHAEGDITALLIRKKKYIYIHRKDISYYGVLAREPRTPCSEEEKVTSSLMFSVLPSDKLLHVVRRYQGLDH